ncbi:SMP-30/gluconolactonase/LRE family protein, partial [Frankia canadensis]
RPAHAQPNGATPAPPFGAAHAGPHGTSTPALPGEPPSSPYNPLAASPPAGPAANGRHRAAPAGKPMPPTLVTGGGPRRHGDRRRSLILVGVAAVAVLAVTVGLLVGLGVLSGGGKDDRRAAYPGPPVTLTGLANAGALALAADGSLYLTDPGTGTGQGQVVRLTADGRAARIGGSGPRPTPTGDVPSPSPTPVLGDGGQPLAAELQKPAGVAIGPDGAIYVAETDAGRVRRIGPDGIITTVAGAGPRSSDGSTADSGDATRAHLDDPVAVAVDAHGVLYIAEGYRIRRVEAGQISTVAGRASEYGSAGDGGPAVNATLYRPSGLLPAKDGGLYVADEGNDTVRRIDRSGRISLVAGTPGTYGSRGDGRAAVDAQLDDPQGLALDPDGTLYIADSGNDVVRRIDRNGVITTAAGTGSGSGSDRDGALATQSALSEPAGVVLDPSGALYIACAGDGTVRRVGTDGFLTTVLRPPPGS